MGETPIKLIIGTIYPLPGSRNFNREAWCQFLGSRAEFRHGPPRTFPNPWKRDEMMTIYPNPDGARVVLDGREVGGVHWSRDPDDPLIHVEVEPVAMPLVQEWAAAMGGEFREEPDKFHSIEYDTRPRS